MADGDVLDRLEHRIARLERQNRRLRGAFAGTLVLMALLGLAGFTRMQERVVRAQKFELVNAQGTTVSEWSVGRHGPLLRLGDLIRANAAVGFTSAGNPSFQVSEPAGKLRISLGLESDVNGTMLLMNGPEPVGGGVTSGITMVHVPRYGPVLTMKEANRTVFTTRPGE